MPLAAERDTVRSFVPSLSPTLAVAADMDATGWESSSVIVPVPVAAEIVALVGELIFTSTVSLGSFRASPFTETSMSFDVSPAENVRVPAVIAS